MKKDNRIITDENENILFCGDKTLKYIKKDKIGRASCRERV